MTTQGGAHGPVGGGVPLGLDGPLGHAIPLFWISVNWHCYHQTSIVLHPLQPRCVEPYE
ncbi:hypothetical protein FM101_03505 [Arthrobacter rhombi]|uniref:Uncharacterized protein n=1 Tax=Arthrobacter rhombi TaxID=71253 RepID=A0A1R4FE39_9MICC|nr:hypothetical protein FM101_03505 [Arthrobacter rhombi]